MLAKLKKLIGSALGGATGVGVAAVAEHVGLDLSTDLSALIAVVLAGVGTYVSPKNEEPEEFRDADELFVDREDEEAESS